MSHTCKNLLLRCMDFRLEETFEKWLQEQGFVGDTDIISVAGSCKALSEFPNTSKSVDTMDDIKLGVEKHGVSRLILTMHEDCGAYGGAAAFPDKEAEKEKLLADMKKSQTILQQQYPHVEVLTFFLAQDGAEGWVIEEVK